MVLIMMTDGFVVSFILCSMTKYIVEDVEIEDADAGGKLADYVEAMKQKRCKISYAR